MPIYRNESDFWRLLINFYYLNNTDRVPLNWIRDLSKTRKLTDFVWPEEWEPRKPLVSILAYSLMPNHLHLFLKEIAEDGISKFIQRISISYSKFLNEKYGESGSLFEAAYKRRIIEEDFDFQHLGVYIMVKNPFELHPGGLQKAISEFDFAYEQVIRSPFNSLAEYSDKRNFPFVEKDLLGELYPTASSFKSFARECMLYKIEQLEAAFNFDRSQKSFISEDGG